MCLLEYLGIGVKGNGLEVRAENVHSKEESR